MTRVAPAVSMMLADSAWDGGAVVGPLEDVDPAPLLSPIDLQCVNAAGVTFAVSVLERVIEGQALGDHARAANLRDRLKQALDGSIRSVKPGTPEAAALKEALIAGSLWSQYLEVAIGPDAEIFTESPLLSTVGWNATIGVRSDCALNNPEPEEVVVADAGGRAVGATLGNDVNLRDFEGWSALPLGKAKDNNASCSLGPLIRLFDDGFTMAHVRTAYLSLMIEGTDGYRLRGASTMREISRDPEELLRQTTSEHDYPDGFVLFCGTLFAPNDNRDTPGHGFTHKPGDVVTIASEQLGTLTNTVATSRNAPPWRLGLAGLMRNLASRGSLGK